MSTGEAEQLRRDIGTFCARAHSAKTPEEREHWRGMSVASILRWGALLSAAASGAVLLGLSVGG